MTKSLTHEIAGVKFRLTIEAKEVLQNYLESIRKYFDKYPDGDEIYTDLEGRIAEKLQSASAEGKEVVTEKDVNAVVAAMGEVEDFSVESDDSAAKIGLLDRFKFTRLKRDVANQKIAGVCAGVANYLDVDPAIVRILFCLVTIVLLFARSPFLFFPILVYLALWVSMPEAKTVLDKLEVKGEAVTLAKLDKQLKQQVRVQVELTGLRKFINIPLDLVAKLANVMVVTLRKLFPWSVKLTGFSILAISLITLISAVTIASVILFSPDSQYIGIPLALIISKQNLFWLLIVTLLVIGIPLLGGMGLGMSMLRMKNTFRPLPSIIGLGFWVFGIVALVTLGFINFDQIKQRVEQNPGVFTPVTVKISSLDAETLPKIYANGDINVEVVYAPKASVSVRSLNKDFDKVNVVLTNKGLEITSTYSGQAQFCIFCIVSKPTVVVETPIVEYLVLSGKVKANFTNAARRNMSINLADSAQLSAKGEFLNIEIHQQGQSMSSFSGTATGLTGQIHQLSQVNSLEMETSIIELHLTGTVQAYISAEKRLVLDLRDTSSAFYVANDAEVDISRYDDAIAFPYRYAHGEFPNLREVEIFLSYDTRFQQFMSFMYGHTLRMDENGVYYYLFSGGERLWITVGETSLNMSSVVFQDENGLRELIPQK